MWKMFSQFAEQHPILLILLVIICAVVVIVLCWLVFKKEGFWNAVIVWITTRRKEEKTGGDGGSGDSGGDFVKGGSAVSRDGAAIYAPHSAFRFGVNSEVGNSHDRWPYTKTENKRELGAQLEPTLPVKKEDGAKPCLGEECDYQNIWRRLCEYPFIIRTGFDAYIEFAVAISDMAKDFLLWTMNTSPLDVNANYDKHGRTNYDNAFIEFKAKKKIRLVIFPEITDAKHYKEASNSKRKHGFEEGHDTKSTIMLFTIRGFLSDLGLVHTSKGKLEEPPDMGYILSGNKLHDGLVFHSEFHTNRDSQSLEQKRTMFYPYAFLNDTYDSLSQFLPFHSGLISKLFEYPKRVYGFPIFFSPDRLDEMCKQYEQRYHNV